MDYNSECVCLKEEYQTPQDALRVSTFLANFHFLVNYPFNHKNQCVCVGGDVCMHVCVCIYIYIYIYNKHNNSCFQHKLYIIEQQISIASKEYTTFLNIYN